MRMSDPERRRELKGHSLRWWIIQMKHKSLNGLQSEESTGQDRTGQDKNQAKENNGVIRVAAYSLQ